MADKDSKMDVVNAVDLALACGGAATGVYLLGVLEGATGLKLYCPPLAAGAGAR